MSWDNISREFRFTGANCYREFVGFLSIDIAWRVLSQSLKGMSSCGVESLAFLWFGLFGQRNKKVRERSISVGWQDQTAKEAESRESRFLTVRHDWSSRGSHESPTKWKRANHRERAKSGRAKTRTHMRHPQECWNSKLGDSTRSFIHPPFSFSHSSTTPNFSRRLFSSLLVYLSDPCFFTDSTSLIWTWINTVPWQIFYQPNGENSTTISYKLSLGLLLIVKVMIP